MRLNNLRTTYGWNAGELRTLPLAAWESFLKVVDGFVQQPPSGTSTLFRRIPLEKGATDVPKASDIRPVDIFSLPMRCLSSCQVASLIAWKKEVLHLGQYASKKGAVAAS